LDLDGNELSVHVEEDAGEILVYVATTQEFVVVDASTGFPRVVVSTNTKDEPGELFDPQDDIPQDVVVVGDRAYVPIWMGGLLVVDIHLEDPPEDSWLDVIQELETDQAFFKVAAGGMNVYVTEGQCGLRVFGITEEGLAPAFFETLENPIKLGDGVAECPDPGPDDTWAWDLDEASGWIFATNAVWARPGQNQGSFQSIDFSQPGAGGFWSLPRRRGCGLGAELALLIPLLAVCRRLRGRSRQR
jgi:hypothetical protein